MASRSCLSCRHLDANMTALKTTTEVSEWRELQAGSSDYVLELTTYRWNPMDTGCDEVRSLSPAADTCISRRSPPTSHATSPEFPELDRVRRSNQRLSSSISPTSSLHHNNSTTDHWLPVFLSTNLLLLAMMAYVLTNCASRFMMPLLASPDLLAAKIGKRARLDVPLSSC
ncbi:hypothetical protein EJ06DRAFT_201498 [Trichodelitschia bisporula]|uniref:Uncharacterized protein n=1 Tax=Trichodelitschia bisporula TaxID=703511 RepID=A0A6G1I881_9PEZI|nr:hypothetical protein EJ06DRAFT_201498 [Trichodelitschia bisporula]